MEHLRENGGLVDLVSQSVKHRDPIEYCCGWCQQGLVEDTAAPRQSNGARKGVKQPVGLRTTEVPTSSASCGMEDEIP